VARVVIILLYAKRKRCNSQNLSMV